jgi:hypothetical protein
VYQVTAVQALSEPPALSEEDAALLVAAHMDLVAAQAAGVQVLGSSAGRELVAAAHTQLATSGAFVLVTVPLGDDTVRVPLPIAGPGFVSSPASSRNEVAA